MDALGHIPENGHAGKEKDSFPEDTIELIIQVILTRSDDIGMVKVVWL